MSEAYLVNIFLPNQVVFSKIRVTKGEFPGADILIGMDVIGSGDFAVTNNNGRTVFSFRIPSQSPIDFAQEINQQNLPRPKSQTPRKKRREKRKPKSYGKNKRSN